jgi:arginyl-tRNA synthetase
MTTRLIDTLTSAAYTTVRRALDAVGLDEVQEFRLSPPKEANMGDLGLACFPFARILRKRPALIAEDLVEAAPKTEGILSVEAVNGYLNLRFDPAYYIPRAVNEVLTLDTDLFRLDDHKGETLQIEFSGPNTNKPQHLGHVRNNVLGLAMSNLWEAVGYRVVRTNIINDRGIHICKSMLAYKLFGEGVTPESTGRKGDFFVGDYYVLFDKKFNEEYEQYAATAGDDKLDKDPYFNSDLSNLGKQAREMLQKWEDNDKEVRELWALMNGWVFDGFNETYSRMGINFEWVDYESDTYLLGKDVVDRGRDSGLFFKREDGATVCDLEPMGKEGQKVLLRSDGTSVYMTQDIGTAHRRFQKFDPQRLVYVVANEQDYHFEVLFGILNMMEEGLGDRCYHLSYGMVDLPHGRMKSREGTVVDADNLMDELKQMSLEKVLASFPDIDPKEAEERAEKIGQAGLKYFILKFTPASRIKFDPEQSINEKGETGVYCLYTNARANSIATKADVEERPLTDEELSVLQSPLEAALAKQLMQCSDVLRASAEQINPSLLASYLWQLSKAFSTFYQDRDHRIIDSPLPLKEARLALIRAVQVVLREGLALFGIETIDKM